MNGDAADALLLALLVLLPASALAARRLPLSALAKMAAVWVAIFGVLLILVLGWQSLTSAGAQIGSLFH